VDRLAASTDGGSGLSRVSDRSQGTVGGPPSPLKVSVIVPAYNAGRYVDAIGAAMAAQSMPQDEFEVIVVDDGSTDDTAERLEALAARQPNVRWIRIPNSGWPGRPRNVGIEAARGEYVQFLDQDDGMPPWALEGLYAMGRAQHSDIVIGKVASNFRVVPDGLFRITRERCSIRDAPLIDSLTPHKLFRTGFLREHGIAFPEGRRRLEDQLFMVRAYFAAGNVSVLGDRVYYLYARREDAGNSGDERIEPDGYYGNLREVLDVVVANTQPGTFRRGLLRRFYRVEILGRLSEPAYPRHDDAYRLRLFEAARSLAADFMDDDLCSELGTVLWCRSELLRSGREADLLEFARRCGDVVATANATKADLTGERLALDVGARLDLGGRPLRLTGSRSSLALDDGLTGGLLPGPVRLREDAAAWRFRVSLRQPATGEEWLLPARTEPAVLHAAGDGSIEPRVHRRVRVDLATVAGGAPLPVGTWQLWIRFTGPGVDRRSRIAVAEDVARADTDGPAAGAAIVRDELGMALLVVPTPIAARRGGGKRPSGDRDARLRRLGMMLPRRVRTAILRRVAL
jgi:glycosyltransferase involved in cell wall biosynthesis